MKKHLIIILCLITSSCAHKIGSLDNFHQIVMDSVENFPNAKELKDPKLKVVIFDFEDNNELAKKFNLGEIGTWQVEKILSESGYVSLLDRTIHSKLKNEITLSEINQTGSYEGPKIADYAVIGKISNASFTSKLTTAINKGSVLTSVVNKEFDVKTDKIYQYTADISGVLKIVSIPSMEVVKTISFNRKLVTDELATAEQLNVLFLQHSKIKEAKSTDGVVLSNAVKEGIIKHKYDILETISPKGYVLEKRINTKDPKTTIFKVNLGKNHGVNFGDMVKFSVFNKDTEANESLNIGIVTDVIGKDISWVIVKDHKKASKIKIGTEVGIILKRGFFSNR